MKTKNYSSAPLPFQGQKRRFVKAFENALTNIEAPKIFVDLFGGSGLLSHVAKRNFPRSKVVYNDYDNYSERLLNADRTNALLVNLKLTLSGYPKDEKITPELRSKIMERLEIEDNNGFVDWITISSNLLFSMNYVLTLDDFKKQTLYNCIRSTDYVTDGYLNGLDVVRMDYKELFELYKNVPGVLFLVDPPYLSTDSSTYSSDDYWKLKDYLNVLNVLVGTDYIYFTSNKSSILELAEWIGDNLNAVDPFKDAVRKEIEANIGRNSKYMDIMLYKIAS